MHTHDDASESFQEGMRDARTHVNRQKSHGVQPPRTVAEQVEELTSVADDGRRRRDPLRAADAQHVEDRGNSVGGAWIDTSQGANDERDDVYFEKIDNPDNTRRRSGSGVVGK